MPTGLPPVQTQDWAAHQDDTYETLTKDHSSQIDTAIQAQSSLDQETAAHDQQLDQSWQQTTQQHAAALDAAIQGQQQSADQSWRATTDQHAAQIDAAIQAQSGLTAAPVTRDQYATTSVAPATTPVAGGELQDYARAAATRAGIDPETFVRQIQQESGFDPTARNPSGATGIAQIVPSAHPGVDPTDPRASLDYAANWMAQLTKSYGGDKAKALAAYNAGPGNVEKYGGIPPFEETQRYVRTILGDQTGDALGAATPAPGGRNADIAPPASTGARINANDIPNQFGRDQGLTDAEAAAACGPALAVWFAQTRGRNPSLKEAVALGRHYGWDEAGGMNGLANESRLLTEMQVPHRVEQTADEAKLAADANSGNPVGISTGFHYFGADAYDPQTRRFHVGMSGTNVRGGSEWMTLAEMDRISRERSGTGLNGAIYVDSPASPTPSPTVTGQPPQAEPPLDDQEPAAAALTQAYQRGDQPAALDPHTPDLPGLPMMGPGGLFALHPNKPVRDPEIERKVLAGEELTAGDLMGALTKQASHQYESTPAALEGVAPGLHLGTSEEALGKGFARGLTEGSGGGGGLGGLAKAAGEVGGDAGALGADLKAGIDALQQARVPVPRKLAEEASTAPASSTVFGQFWNRARNVIEQQGPAGKELGQGLRDWRNLAETTAGDWTTQLQSVRKLGQDEFKQFVDVAEGKATTSNPVIQQAVTEWDAVRTAVYERAKEAGLDIGHLDNYFPHLFEPGTFSGKGWTQSIDHLVESGQAETRAAAAQMLRYAQDVRRNRRYGNLEAERDLNLPFYRKDKGVIFGQGGYLEAAANRIAQIETFGQKDENALKLVDLIGQQGGDAGAAKALFDISVGATKYGELQKRASAVARGANTVASLGLSAITNVGQTANTATVAGFGPTLGNVWKSLRSPEAKEYAVKAGVTLDNVVQDVREGTGMASRALGKITAPGFSTVETFNRTLALHAGVAYAEDAARKAAQGDRGAVLALQRLGLDANAVAERGTLTEAEKMTAGRSMVERTQFKVDPMDLPGWTASPMGKLFTQFKSFSYNQSAFLGREIIQPALKGDLKPLTRFMIAGLLSGAATTETRNVIQARQPEQDPTKRIIQYYQAAGGLGLVGDVLRVTSPIININADRLDPDRVVTQAVGTVLGPTVGTGIEALSGIAQATRGNPTPGLRSATRRIPVVGTTLQNLLFPYKPRPDASAPAGRSSTKPPPPPRPPSPPKPPKR